MKKAKYIALSSIALLLAGCASDDVLSTAQEDANAIVFNANSNVTRGTKVPSSDLTDTYGFSVYANAMKNGQPTPIMENTKVTKSTSSTTGWEYAPIVYWPNDGSTVDFYGIYQQNFDGRNVLLSYGYDKRPKITYIVPQTIDDHKDILWAPPVLNATSATGTVNFAFQHILTAVSMQVTGVEITDDMFNALKTAAASASSPGILDNFKTMNNPDPLSTPATDELVIGDIKNLQVESIEIMGDFPTHGIINPMATEPDKAWVMYYDETERGGRTYKFENTRLTTNGTTVETKSDSYLFLLPSTQTRVTLKVTFSFDLERSLEWGGDNITGKYRFTLQKIDNNCEFKPGEELKLILNPDLTKAPELLIKTD